MERLSPAVNNKNLSSVKIPYLLINLAINVTNTTNKNLLVNMGVPKQDIVIGFHSPFKRQFTEYAVG